MVCSSCLGICLHQQQHHNILPMLHIPKINTHNSTMFNHIAAGDCCCHYLPQSPITCLSSAVVQIRATASLQPDTRSPAAVYDTAHTQPGCSMVCRQVPEAFHNRTVLSSLPVCACTRQHREHLASAERILVAKQLHRWYEVHTMLHDATCHCEEQKS